MCMTCDDAQDTRDGYDAIEDRLVRLQPKQRAGC